LYILGIRKMMK